MRVIAGSARGRTLVAPAGRGTRPTADRVRQAVFNILGAVEGSRCLDLFAGTGGMAIEALSRGAAEAVLVERDPGALRAIRANLSRLGWEERARVLPRDVFWALSRLDQRGQRFDLIFLDPPYERGLVARTASAAARLLAETGRMVVEHSRRELPGEEGLRRLRRAAYGDTVISIYSVAEEQDA